MLEVFSNPLGLTLHASQMARCGIDQLQLRARRSQFGHGLLDQCRAVRGAIDEFDKLALAAGKDPAQMVKLIAFCVLLADSEEELESIICNPVIQWDVARIVPGGEVWKHYGQTNPLGENWSYAGELFPLDWSREETLKICHQVSPEMVRNLRLCGTPEQVADMIQPYIEAGCNHVVLGDYSGVVTTPDFFGGTGDKHTRLFNRLRTLNGQPLK